MRKIMKNTFSSEFITVFIIFHSLVNVLNKFSSYFIMVFIYIYTHNYTYIVVHYFVIAFYWFHHMSSCFHSYSLFRHCFFVVFITCHHVFSSWFSSFQGCFVQTKNMRCSKKILRFTKCTTFSFSAY